MVISCSRNSVHLDGSVLYPVDELTGKTTANVALDDQNTKSAHAPPSSRQDARPAEDLGLQSPSVRAEFDDTVEERLRGAWPVPQGFDGVSCAVGHLKVIHPADVSAAVAQADGDARAEDGDDNGVFDRGNQVTRMQEKR